MIRKSLLRFLFPCMSVVFVLCGCGNPDGNPILTKIPGTERVDVNRPSLSISPDGEYMVFISDSDRYENNGHRVDFNIESLRLSSGEIRQHRPADGIDKKAFDHITRCRETIGWSYFQEESWHEGKFYIWMMKCLEIDPQVEEYLNANIGCGWDLRCSDRVDRAYLSEVVKTFREKGAMEKADLYQVLSRGSYEVRNLTIPTSVDRSNPVLYYAEGDAGFGVYRSDGKVSERIYKYGGFLTGLGLDQIKVSPDGRYLAMVRNRIVSAPVPVPGSGFDLTILDLEEDKKFVLKTSQIGSCVWAPDSKTLYLACSDDGDGIYRLLISDAFH